MDGIRKVYIDIMVAGRFYHQLPYHVIGGGNIPVSALQEYVCAKLPTLRGRRYVMNFSEKKASNTR